MAKKAKVPTETRGASGEQTTIDLPRMKMFDNPAFRYTSPSAASKVSPAQRRKKGCIERTKTRHCFESDTGKDKCYSTEAEAKRQANGEAIFTKKDKKFTGQRCAAPRKDGSCAPGDEVYDADCKGAGDPCGSSRSTCPVQLVWVDGKPNLRFCKAKKEPGYLVPVRNVAEAMQISDEACAKWPYKLGAQVSSGGEDEDSWDADFFDKNAPQIPKVARSAYPQSGGLGNMPRRGNPAWIAAGVAMGVMAAVLIKKRQAAPAAT